MLLFTLQRRTRKLKLPRTCTSRLVAPTPLSGSMLSETPGVRSILVINVSSRMACDHSDSIGKNTQNSFALGAKGQIQGIHPSPTPLSLILLAVDYSTFSCYTTGRLTKPYPGGPNTFVPPSRHWLIARLHRNFKVYHKNKRVTTDFADDTDKIKKRSV